MKSRPKSLDSLLSSFSLSLSLSLNPLVLLCGIVSSSFDCLIALLIQAILGTY